MSGYAKHMLSTEQLRTRKIARKTATKKRSFGFTRLRLNARDLNALYVYLPLGQLKKLVSRFAEVA